MAITLGVQFTKSLCRAAILHEKNDANTPITLENANGYICTAARTLEFDSETKTALPIAIQVLKSIYQNPMRIIISIPSEQTMMRDFTIDTNLSDIEIMRFLQTQSIALFGHDAKELCLDYETKTDSDNNKKITAVAALRSNINLYQTTFYQAKMPLDAIDVEPFSQARGITLLSENKLINQTSETNDTLNNFSAALGLCLWRKHD